MAEQQLELARGLARACEQMDLSAMSDILHPDHVHVTLPSSVNIPKQNKAQCLEYYEKIFDNWAKVEPVSCSLSQCSRPSSTRIKPLMQPIVTALANTPGKVVVHVRIANVQSDTASSDLLTCPIDYQRCDLEIRVDRYLRINPRP